jgi:multicomponent Na+:H+ antiporter subunit E
MLKVTLNAIGFTVFMVILYFLWTQNTHWGDLAMMGILGFFVFLVFRQTIELPQLTVKRGWMLVLYILYLLKEMVKANFDVARRVIQPRMNINPGIVKTHTRLTSPVARMFLANSITLTPGTLSVELKGQDLYVHWIDVTGIDEASATATIVRGFERYLEVIFG